MAGGPYSPARPVARIVSMSAWDQDFVDEEEEGYFEFNERGAASSTSAMFTGR